MALHGFPETGDAWRDVAPIVAEAGHRVVAPDQRGYAPEARPPPGPAYRLDALAADVVAVAAALGHDRFDVVGHDWGAMVAWYLAATKPDVVRTLTAVSTPHPLAFAEALIRGPQALRSVYAGLFMVPGLAERVLGLGDHRLLGTMLRSSGLPDDRAQHWVEAVGRSGALRTALAWYRANGLAQMREVGPVAVPTLHVWSRGDAALGPTATRRTAAHVTGPYRLEVLDGSHWVPETQASALGGLIVDHLAAHPGR